MRLLLVEDDLALGPSLKARLEYHRYAVDWLTDGADALAAALAVPYDMLIVDVLLPSLSGFDLCRQLRARGLVAPILLLTALSEVEQRITGLDAGADDYLCKPFAMGELEARVRALLRRQASEKTAVLRFSDLALDTRTHEVWRGDRLIPLTAKEYALLDVFLRHPRQALTRAALVEHVWDFEVDHLSNVLEVFIANLRRKLCAAGEPDLLVTLRGVGYSLREPLSS